MELTHALRQLWRLKLGVIAVVAIAALVALSVAFRVSLFPPSLQSKSYEFGAASTQVIVDQKRSPVADVRELFEPLATRAEVYARLMTSTPLRNYIGEELGIPGAAIIAEGPPAPNATRAEREPLAGERANSLFGEGVPLRLSLRAEDELPVVSIAAQAPTAKGAEQLANAAVAGLMRYVAEAQERSRVRPGAQVRLTQLGEPQGGLVNSGVNRTMPIVAFFAVLAFGLVLLLWLGNLVRNWREAGMQERTLGLDETNGWDERELAPLDLGTNRPIKLKHPVAGVDGSGSRSASSRR